jgi:hypothetical protein
MGPALTSRQQWLLQRLLKSIKTSSRSVDKLNACGRHYRSSGKPVFVYLNVSK